MILFVFCSFKPIYKISQHSVRHTNDTPNTGGLTQRHNHGRHAEGDSLLLTCFLIDPCSDFLSSFYGGQRSRLAASSGLELVETSAQGHFNRAGAAQGFEFDSCRYKPRVTSFANQIPAETKLFVAVTCWKCFADCETSPGPSIGTRVSR